MLRFPPIYFLPVNKASETFMADGGAERIQLRVHAFGNEFNAPVGQVADDAGDFKTGGDGFDGIAESDALDAAGIKNIQATAFGVRRAFG